MATIDLKQLVARLNDTTRRALEAAAGLTLSRTPTMLLKVSQSDTKGDEAGLLQS